MTKMKAYNIFATKWLNKFKNPDINYMELVDHFMADDCASLGFEMDCGQAFGEKYGNAANNARNLELIIDSVDDIMLLGSAIYSQWRYFNHWAYSGAEILESDNRAWFVTALERLTVLTENNSVETENRNGFLNQYQKRLQKAQIISDLLCYGSGPMSGDPVEQHLTISSTGRIWFSERVFGSYGCNQYPIGRKTQMSIGKECAASILSKLADYADSNPPLIFCTDIGSWHLTLTGTDGTKKEMSCSMSGDVFAGDDDLTDFIRTRIPIDGLAVFG